MGINPLSGFARRPGQLLRHLHPPRESAEAQDITAKLKAILPPNPFVIPKKDVEKIKKALHLTTKELLMSLLPIAKEYARPLVTKYCVGAAGLGKSGNIYLGVNLQFTYVPSNQDVHGEQFFLVNAFSHGEKELTMLALSAPPCGHCRQFLNELGTSDTVRFFWPQQTPVSLKKLFPHPFGPEVRGLKGELIAPRNNGLRVEGLLHVDERMVQAALKAANASYSPYRNSPSGVSIKTKDGKIYSGSYLENVAANPSLPPLQAALVSLVADGKPYDSIAQVLLLEKENSLISHESFSRYLLKRIAPDAVFHKGKLL